MSKNFTLIIILSFLSFGTAFCQSSYNQGFEEGYKKGYCYEKFNCIPPISPIAPIPNIGESINSYQDGYNRGFKTGLNASEKNNSTRERYKTTNPNAAIDYKYKPTELETEIGNNAQQNFETGISRAQELIEEGKYSDCISLCNLISNMTHLVSYKYYILISMSYEGLGNRGQSKKYANKAQKFLEKH